MSTVVLGTDGSELSLAALAASLPTLRLTSADTVVVATVADEPDVSLVTGASGFAGGAMSADEFADLQTRIAAEAEQAVADAKIALGLDWADTRVVWGRAGPALCDLAGEVVADIVVVGSRGRGGIKRALLGSVSDHVVRHAPCSVMVTREAAD